MGLLFHPILVEFIYLWPLYIDFVSSNLANPVLTLMQLLLSIFTVILLKIPQVIHYCFALIFWIYSHHHQFFLNIFFCDLDLLFDIIIFLEVQPLLNSLFIWKCLCFTIMHKRSFFLGINSELTDFSPPFEGIIALFSDFHCCYWEVCWQSAFPLWGKSVFSLWLFF